MADDVMTVRRETLEREIRALVTSIVERQVKDFEAVRGIGARLYVLRDQALWEGQAATWEEYCRETFGFGRDRASQIIRAYQNSEDLRIQLVLESPSAIGAIEAQVIERQLISEGLPMPKNERQLRVLSSVPRELRPAVWRAALAYTPAPTVATIKLAVDAARDPIGAGTVEAARQNNLLDAFKKVWWAMSVATRVRATEWVESQEPFVPLPPDVAFSADVKEKQNDEQD